MKFEHLKNTDPEVFQAIQNEIEREQKNIVMIASENYVSQAVLEVQGSVFTNKYAEGYPAKGITAVASMRISLRISQLTGQKNYSGQNM